MKKEQGTEENRRTMFVDQWHSVYCMMPVFQEPPQMPTLETLLQALSATFGPVQPLSETPKMPTEPNELLAFALLDHLSDQQVPTQLVLYGPNTFDKDLWDDGILAQFWDCGDDRREFASRCQYSIMASNMMAAMLPMVERYGIMADYADMLLELFPDCIGIYWPHSQRLVPRERFLEVNWTNKNLHFLDGGLQVRFFNIADSDEMLFDTLGFTAIGLPDLQCHCKALDPNEVVGFLRNLASYLYQNGDVIQDGHTVEGIDHAKWPCQHEDALLAPMRVVLDICPGKYAGGNRATQ